jgi:hypothetical protein
MCRLRIYEARGTVTVGGLRSSDMYGIHGVLLGEPTRVSRDDALPVVEPDELARWASEQVDLVHTIVSDPEARLEYAEMVWRCGGDTGALPIAEGSNGFLAFRDIAAWRDPPDELVLIGPYDMRSVRRIGQTLTLNRDVLATEMARISIISSDSEDLWLPRRRKVEHPYWDFYGPTLVGAVIEALAAAWSASPEDVLRVSVYRPRRKRRIGNVGGSPLYVIPDWLLRNPNAPPRRPN